MNTITLTNDNQKAVFTPRSVNIDGIELSFSSVSEIKHCERDRLYSISAGERNASFSYEEKDAKALSTLFSRVAHLRNIEIEEVEPASNKEDAEPEVSSESVGLLQRPVFLVAEAAVALLLIAVAIYLLFIAF